MSVLPTGLRPHMDDEVHVLAPAVHRDPQVLGQLHVDAMDHGHVQHGLGDGLLQLVIARRDQARHGPIRRELLQDRLAIPRDLAILRLDDQHVAMQEGT